MPTVEFLPEWTIRSSILIAGGALLLWLLRVKDSSIRAAARTAILRGSLAIPVLNLAFPKTILPTLRRTAAGVVVRPVAGALVVVSEPAADAVPTPRPAGPVSRYSARGASHPEPPATRHVDFGWAAMDWTHGALMFYALTCGVLLLRLCAGLLVGWRLLGRSSATGRVIGGIVIRESGDLAAPLTLGIFRSAIVLPASWREWDDAKLEAVLAHERSHIQRHDPWVQLLSGIHRALLWCSPLSWFLHRWILQTPEEASDDAAVAAIHDRVFYAEMLLDFMRRGVWNTGFAGVSMARYDFAARVPTAPWATQYCRPCICW